jgi:hypothetical protein
MKLSNSFNILNPIWVMDNFLTFWGMGGGTQNSTSSTGIDPAIRPYVTYGLNEAKNLYQSNTPQYYKGQTWVDPSAQTQAALQAAQNRAIGGNPLLPAAQQQQQDVLSGKYLANNPYFNQAMQGAAQGAQTNYYDAVNAANSNMSQSGRYGSGAQANVLNKAGTTLGNSLANAYGNLAYQNYGAERGRQEAAAAGAPSLANADYGDIEKLMQVGQIGEGYQNQALQGDINRFNYQQNLPYQKLAAYTSTLTGLPMGQVTNTTQSGGKIVCTAMCKEYGFGSFRQAVWLAQSKDLDPAYEKGYHALFLPLVNYAYKSGVKNTLQNFVRKLLENIARHRTADIWKQKRGKKRDAVGMIYRAILEPICYVVGKVAR